MSLDGHQGGDVASGRASLTSASCDAGEMTVAELDGHQFTSVARLVPVLWWINHSNPRCAPQSIA